MAGMRTKPNLACTHGVWPCCPVSVSVYVCVCVCLAKGSLHLNIYQGQRLPKGESYVVFTGRLPNERMKTTLHSLASYCHSAPEQGT